VLETADDAPTMVADMLEQSVRLRTRADVPVGVCLSGGLDSTAIACAIARHRRAVNDDAPLLAYNFNTEEFDETRYIDETLRQTGARLVQPRWDVRSAWSSLNRVLHFHDEPLHSMNALVSFDLMRLARRHGTLVVLNGQGSDEILAGYSSYHEAHWLTQVLDGHPGHAWADIQDYAKTQGTNPYDHVRTILRTLTFAAVGRIPGYDALARFARARSARHNPHYSPELMAKLPPRTRIPDLRLEGQQRLALTESPLPLYLRIEDRNSMAHGVEVRLPFLDPRLVQYSLSLPIASRMRGALNKLPLREGLRGRIPDVVQSRVDKMGFPVPTHRWFGNELYQPLRDLLDSSASRSRGIFRTDALIAGLDASRGGVVHDHGVLFRAANVEAWLGMVAERRTRQTAARTSIVASDSPAVTQRRPSDPSREVGRMIAMFREPSAPPPPA
jgi:asparagine synthase (glutamine-hydrolysing)